MKEIIIVGSLLLISSLLDICYKKISLILLTLYFLGGLVWRIGFCNISVIAVLSGITIGMFMLLISKLSNGAVGMGDGLLLIVTGCLLGIRKNLMLLFVGLVVAALVSLFLIVIKKVKKNYEIPFVPFLLIAYVGMVFHEI